MKQGLILVSGTAVALALGSLPGCSSEDDIRMGTPMLTPGSGGSASSVPGGAGTGNQTAAAGGGTAGSGSAAPGAGGSGEVPPPVMMIAPGAAGSSANAGSAMGGAAGAPPAAGGAGGAPPAPVGDPSAMCPAAAMSPSDGRQCTVTCTDDCGVQALGTRLCTCTNSLFDCASCEFTVMHPLLTPPTMALEPCAAADAAQEDDGSGCMDNQRCQSLSGADRFCGCLSNKWDCDGKPDTFDF